MKNYQQVHCQRCRAANPLGEELCGQCGTRLMLVVEPASLRFEEDALATGQAEGVVAERLSLMENNLTRVLGHLERSTDLLTKQAQIVTKEHTLLEALIELLSEAGVIDVRELVRRWEANATRSAEDERQKKLRADVCETIVRAYSGREAQQFAQLVKEGFAAFNERQIDEGWRLLERAAALAPRNAPLNELLARQFFQEGKLTLARSYMERAYAAAPQNAGSCLMLAVAYGEEGDAAGALALLDATERLGGASPFAVNYVRGRLHAHAGRWRDALAAFKRALAARAAPETHYAVALAAYLLKHLKLADAHLHKALALDAKYAAALNLLGLVRRKSGDAAGARNAFAQARALAGGKKDAAPTKTAAQAKAATQAKDAAQGKGGAGRAPRYSDELLLQTFFGGDPAQRRRLLTGGDERLVALLFTEA
ncbi:MAG TPA: tetratricopeptide repeat protein [Pyrinomonadaceae bacterium]|jgi:tetratricopeptide (TPR) repeat protein